MAKPIGYRVSYRFTGQIVNLLSWFIALVIIWNAFNLTIGQGVGVGIMTWALLPIMD